MCWFLLFCCCFQHSSLAEYLCLVSKLRFMVVLLFFYIFIWYMSILFMYRLWVMGYVMHVYVSYFSCIGFGYGLYNTCLVKKKNTCVCFILFLQCSTYGYGYWLLIMSSSSSSSSSCWSSSIFTCLNFILWCQWWVILLIYTTDVVFYCEIRWYIFYVERI